jgi:hypothetical protein
MNKVIKDTFSNKDLITGVVGMVGKTMMLHCASLNGSYAAVDITGPWR